MDLADWCPAEVSDTIIGTSPLEPRLLALKPLAILLLFVAIVLEFAEDASLPGPVAGDRYLHATVTWLWYAIWTIHAMREWLS